MSIILNAFKIKPFDLGPVFATWTDGPPFTGNHKKDPPVATWLDQIKAGCLARSVPEEYWHEAAEHFMGKKAKARLDKVKKVLYEMEGENYRWTWKKFRLLMCNMGWDVDAKATVAVERESSGSWWVVRKKNRSKDDTRKAPVRSKSLPPPTKDTSLKGKAVTQAPSTLPRMPRSKTIQSEGSKALLGFGRSVLPELVLGRNNSIANLIVQAPLWLYMACDVLDTLTGGHPKAMSALSAVLIIAGSVPAIPAVTAGAGGAFLASHTVQAAGAVAVSVGSWIRTRQGDQAQASGSKKA